MASVLKVDDILNLLGTGKPTVNGEEITTAIQLASQKTEIQAIFQNIENKIINPKKSIQQRGTTGGRKQVIEASMFSGDAGVHVLSWSGTATATIKEFPTLLADEATTLADAGTNLLGTAIESGTAVTVTDGYYIHIEFNTTDFSNVRFNKGLVPVGNISRHNELSLCQPFYEKGTHRIKLTGVTPTLFGTSQLFAQPKRSITPTISTTNISGTVISTEADNSYIYIEYDTFASGNGKASFIANAEIFGTTSTYHEDRWFI